MERVAVEVVVPRQRTEAATGMAVVVENILKVLFPSQRALPTAS
jgi:hypothetical protein